MYELLLKFIMHPSLKNELLLLFVNKSFVKSFLELFDSEDPRERDYLKTILHRIYGKYMPLRSYVKEQIMHLLLCITCEAENHNGLTELLEILSSITSGLSVPLKPEHQDFFRRVLVPLHKVKTLQTFNTQLQLCVKNYLEKQPALSSDLVKGLLKYWPLTCPAKEVIFIGEIEEVFELLGSQADSKYPEFGAALLKRLIITAQGMHYQAAERSLLLLNSEYLQKFVKNNMAKAYPIIVKGLLHSSQNSHWNQTVTTITYSVIRSYMELNRDQSKSSRHRRSRNSRRAPPARAKPAASGSSCTPSSLCPRQRASSRWCSTSRLRALRTGCDLSSYNC